MLAIDDFRKQSAQEFGGDALDAIDSKNSVYLALKQPVDDLPELRVRIWPRPSVGSSDLNWTWNWRTVHVDPEVAAPEDGPAIRFDYVGGKTAHDSLYGSIDEAVEAAICSINDYLENELSAER